MRQRRFFGGTPKKQGGIWQIFGLLFGLVMAGYYLLADTCLTIEKISNGRINGTHLFTVIKSIILVIFLLWIVFR